MPTPFLPYQRDPIAGNATTTDAWYQFFIGLRQFLVSSGLDTGIIDQILARLDELEQNQVGAFVIQGLLSVDVFGTPEDGFVQIQLVGDVESPGTNYYYGTDDTGVKGWFNSASNLKIASLTGSTYSTVQDFVNTMHSPGVITGGEVTDIGSGNVRILAGTGMIRIADDDVSSLPFFNFAQTDFAVPNDQLTRFFGVVYNAGSPVVEMRTSYNWNKDTEIPLGSAVRLSATITNVTPNKYRMGDPITNVIQRFDAQSPAIRDNSIGGLLIGEAGVRNVTVTAGKIWSRLSDFDSAAKNSSVDTMLSVYFNGVNLTVTSGITQWDNLNYNTGGALVVMGNNKWANLWFFISIDGTKYGYAYGTGEHNSLGAAANEGLPFYLNQNFFNQTLLLGRFVFQKGAATAGLIETAFASVFNTSAVNNHNDLAGLQGGAVGEYYHLTTLQNTDVTNLSTGGTSAQFWRGDKVYSNTLTGNFNVNGNSVLGDSTADQISVPGKILASDLTATQFAVSTGAIPRVQINGVGANATIVNNQTSLSIARFFNDSTGPNIYIAKSRGSTVNDNTVVSVNGDEVGSFRYEAAHGSGLSRGAVFQVFVDGVPAGTTVPMRFSFQTLPSSGGITERLNIASMSTVVNDPGADYDFRVEGDTLTHLLFCDASSTTENIALCSTIQPNWQTMDRGLFIGNAETLPTGNPTAGIFSYVDAGSGKVRTPGGNIVTYAPNTAPTITGSRGGNAALASLLTSLAAAGIIVDGTTP